MKDLLALVDLFGLTLLGGGGDKPIIEIETKEGEMVLIGKSGGKIVSTKQVPGLPMKPYSLYEGKSMWKYYVDI